MADTGDDRTRDVVRLATAGDIHVRESQREEIRESFAAVQESADIVLLAGDLTTHGEPEQGEILADACRDLAIPVFAVLGNHDLHANRARELTRVLEDGGINVLERSCATCEVRGVEIGVVGTKGFVGGFPGSHLPDFGEPLLRELYAETTRDVEALDEGLKAVSHCPVRVVLLHYAPTGQTLAGEPPGIWTMLGNDRIAEPIRQHEPDLVLHGHAHAGTFRGEIGGVPVFNVSLPVMGQPFWVFDLSGVDRASTPIH